MKEMAFQDYYADDYSHCYGCGRLNEVGYQIKSYWEGDEGICRITPEAHHSGGMKDILYGGLIASLMDCHGAGTARLGVELIDTIGPGFQILLMEKAWLAS